MFLKIDGTFVVQLINFAIFFALLNVVFIRPVGKAIVERRRYINSVTNDYDRYQAEATSLRAQAESVRAAARRAAETHLAKARAAASDESAKLSTQYNERVAQTFQDADRAVAAEVAAARACGEPVVNELAGLMVERAFSEQAS